MEMRSATIGPLHHLVPFERKKCFVLPRSPWKSVNSIKTENVIDTEKMKAAPDTANALSPPIKIPATHRVPMKKRDAPVLSPLLRELVLLEMRLGRRAATPIMRK